jgi:hypothetical protein
VLEYFEELRIVDEFERGDPRILLGGPHESRYVAGADRVRSAPDGRARRRSR